MTIAPLSIATFPIAPCLGGSKGNLSPATGILLNQGNMAQVVTDLTNPRCIVGTVHQIVKACHLSPVTCHRRHAFHHWDRALAVMKGS